LNSKSPITLTDLKAHSLRPRPGPIINEWTLEIQLRISSSLFSVSLRNDILALHANW